jgi:Rod binding domain-containing protein
MNVSSIASLASPAVSLPPPSAGGLGSARAGKGAAQPTAAHKAAQQFEAIIVRQLLSQSVGKLMAGGAESGDDTGGEGGGMYGYMLTDAIADKIAQGGGLGLADMLEKQFTPKGVPVPPATPTSPTLP